MWIPDEILLIYYKVKYKLSFNWEKKVTFTLYPGYSRFLNIEKKTECLR